MMIKIGNYGELRTELLKLRYSTEMDDTIKIVRKIINDVRLHGLKGLIKWSLKLDGFKPELYYPEDFEKAWRRLPSTFKRNLEIMADRIKRFHTAQLPSDIKV